MDLAEAVYELTRQFPEDEKFTLTSQMRRAAISVPSNIAEGYGRKRRNGYIYHLSVANGSLKEVESQLILAGRLNYITKETARPAWNLTQSTGKLLNALLNSLTE